jgi:hypothetical protein
MFVTIAILTLSGSCDHNPLLAGALDEDCIPPRLTMSDFGAAPAMERVSNCQAKGSVCCRISATATHTTCQYPEDCYVAPYHGLCATPVDCADTQTCGGGACGCTRGGPACKDPATSIVTCCGAGQVCSGGMCSAPLDGGT